MNDDVLLLLLIAVVFIFSAALADPTHKHTFRISECIKLILELFACLCIGSTLELRKKEYRYKH